MTILWSLSRTFISLVCLFNFSSVAQKYPVIHPEIGPFNEKDYSGGRERSIAAIRYTTRVDPKKWAKQPMLCYGVFIDPKKVVTTCSCVAYPTDGDNLASNPWFHQTNDKLQMTKVPAQYVNVGLMRDEYVDGPLRNVVPVEKVEISPRCKADFKHNLALLTLSASPNGYKLAWLYSADWIVQKWATDKVVVGASAGAGRCEIMRWSDHGRPLQPDSRIEKKYVKREIPHRFRKERTRARYQDGPEIRLDRPWRHQRVLQSQVIEFLPWVDCLEQVCPRYSPAPYDKKKPQWDLNECRNNYTVSRYCVDWYQMDSLCVMVEGTPVFCDVEDIRGVFGLLSNRTIWCGDNFNFRNIMYGIDGITNGLYHIARVRNGPGYDSFGWPEYLDILRTPDDYHLV